MLSVSPLAPPNFSSVAISQEDELGEFSLQLQCNTLVDLIPKGINKLNQIICSLSKMVSGLRFPLNRRTVFIEW